MAMDFKSHALIFYRCNDLFQSYAQSLFYYLS